MADDCRWHPSVGVGLERLPPALAAAEPIVSAVFGLFGAYATVLEAGPDQVAVRCRQIGGAKFQTLLHAALVRQLGMPWPGRFGVALHDMGTPAARIVIRLADRPEGG